MLQRIFNVLFGAFWVAIASVFASVGISTLYQDEQFTGDVERISGTVDQLSQSDMQGHGGRWGGGGGGTVHQVSYHYTVGNVVFHAVKVAVKNSTWQPLHVGDQLPVKYLRNQPGVSRIDLAIEDRNYWQSGEIAASVGILFIGIGLYIALRPIPPPSKTLPLREVWSRMLSGGRNR